MKFLPAIPKKRYYTFLFEEDALVIAKIDKKGNKLEIFQEYPLPEGCIERNEIKNPDALIKLLQDVKEKLKISDKFVVVGISEDQCLNRTLILPPLEDQEIDQAIEYQADSFLPFPYQKECIDWMLISKLENGKQKILVSAIPISVINSYVSVIEKVQFHPIAFESTSLSLFRTLPEENKKLGLAMQFSQNSAVIIFCKDGSIETSSLVHERNHIVETLQKIQNFYLSDPQNRLLANKILISGKSIPENLIDQLKTIGLEAVLQKSELGDTVRGRESEFLILESLLTKDVEPPQDEKTINVIPRAQLEKYENIFRERGSSKVKKILISLLIFLDIIAAFTYYRLVVQTNDLFAKTKSNMSNLNSTDVLKTYVNQAIVINRSSSQNKILGEIPGIIKSNSQLVTINGLNYSEKKGEIIFTGTAMTRNNLMKFKDYLEKRKIFSRVYIPWSSLEKETNIDFRIIATI